MRAKIYEYLASNKPDIIVVEDEKEAEAAGDAAKVLGIKHHILPDFRAAFLDDLRVFKAELDQLRSALFGYYKNSGLLIAPFRTIAHYLPSKRYFSELELTFGDDVELEAFKEQLLGWGYSFVELVSEPGEVSVRGDIIDIFSPNYSQPVRISLFDTQIESIRFFDPATQRSAKEEQESITIIPAFYDISDEREELLQKIEESEADIFVKDLQSLGFWYLKEKINLLDGKDAVLLHPLPIEEHYQNYDHLISQKSFELPIMPEPKKWRDVEIVNLNAYLQNCAKKVTIVAANERIVRRSELKSFENINFLYSDAIINIESDEELLVSLNKQKRKKPRATLVLDELKLGEYVVHETHGIGIFEGIKQVAILGAKRDFVQIGYQGEDKLLVPVENLELLSRYVAEGGSVAVVDKLGGKSFSRLKAKVREKLLEIAADIVKRAAQRELLEGKQIVIDPSIKLFQKTAGFAYTPDQQAAIDAILERLSSGKIMDMLLSGDVGFGKTEVAMNAIFAVVKSGYQAAMVVPTTLLSNQHYKTLKERLEPFDIKVAKIDRFVSTKEKKAILVGLKEGSIDVVVGTHALFGAEFKNLALVVIDEEHKFGVKQKERLKELTKDVHLLSMSATPIPRSLNMALSRLKELAELRTPPSIREAVRTYVREYDQKLIKEAAMREFRRGGQLFYIYNSIAGIQEKQKELQEILPQARILVLHSKVAAATTEKELVKFANREYDILLSTSIVESGIHMPNVNTIIVEGADRFGIADLHQLRGRVGRGGKEGYCYLLVEDKEAITQEAKKRLLALESNSFLGSGAALAYYDLEIRGGGNILGAQQSGHIKNIGYSLYLKMLEEEIAKLTTGEAKEESEVEIKLSVNAYLSSELIGDDRLKLELYRRLAKAASLEEVSQIEEEIVDRFGKPDVPTKNFLDIITIKVLAKAAGIKRISNYGQNITLEFEDGHKEHIKARSKDEDDILNEVLRFLKRL